jgi:hypothetical protein
MATVPAEEHIHFSKLDLADGYWRMRVTREERWNFAYVMPAKPGEELIVVVPSVTKAQKLEEGMPSMHRIVPVPSLGKYDY